MKLIGDILKTQDPEKEGGQNRHSLSRVLFFMILIGLFTE